ncbi:uncharacterized protein PG986_013598 [Apiospora aurea]|uniref:HNH nuclease domain-containing protein n=1 Tax=Apiospora aurea TaxID=335848 RepID=A0ABR1PWK6_9PEZI
MVLIIKQQKTAGPLKRRRKAWQYLFYAPRGLVPKIDAVNRRFRLVHIQGLWVRARHDLVHIQRIEPGHANSVLNLASVLINARSLVVQSNGSASRELRLAAVLNWKLMQYTAEVALRANENPDTLQALWAIPDDHSTTPRERGTVGDTVGKKAFLHKYLPPRAHRLYLKIRWRIDDVVLESAELWRCKTKLIVQNRALHLLSVKLLAPPLK